MARDKGKVVAITVMSKSAKKWSTMLAPAPLKHADTHIVVRNTTPDEMRGQIRNVLVTLEDEDILVFNAHSNEDYFIYGKENTKVHWSNKDQDNNGFWKYFGIKKPPRLTAIVMAACMAPKGKQLSRQKLRELRKIFHTKMMVAPNSTYEWKFWGTKDNRTADNIISEILKLNRGEISGAEINERINRDQDRFEITYGCNGRNHPNGCGCRFG